MSTLGDSLTRRGFLVLSASAIGALFVKPGLTSCDGGKVYVVSMETTGYGFLWDREGEEFGRLLAGDGCGGALGPDARELARESLSEGSILRFMRDPSAWPEAPYLLVIDGASGEAVCDIPWSAGGEDERVVRGIMSKMDGGLEVWGEVVSAKHSTIDAGPQLARIHTIEFDVYCR